MRSTVKNDLLNSLLHISINGPSANSKEADQLLERICNVYAANGKHKKIPQVYSLGKTAKHHLQLIPKTIQRVLLKIVKKKKTSCFNFVQTDLYQAPFMTSNSAEGEFPEEDDNFSDVEVA